MTVTPDSFTNALIGGAIGFVVSRALDDDSPILAVLGAAIGWLWVSDARAATPQPITSAADNDERIDPGVTKDGKPRAAPVEPADAMRTKDGTVAWVPRGSAYSDDS